MGLSPVLVAGVILAATSTFVDSQMTALDNDRRARPRPGGDTPVSPSSKLIQLILRERCQYWLSIGYPLPSYCYAILSGRITPQQLTSAFSEYKKTTSTEQQLRDLKKAYEQLQLQEGATVL